MYYAASTHLVKEEKERKLDEAAELIEQVHCAYALSTSIQTQPAELLSIYIVPEHVHVAQLLVELLPGQYVVGLNPTWGSSDFFCDNPDCSECFH